MDAAGGPQTQQIVTDVTPEFREYYWKLGQITVPYQVDTADAYNVTVQYKIRSDMVYSTTLQLWPAQAEGTGSYYLQRPTALIFEARRSFDGQYLSPHTSNVTNSYVGILDIPIYVFYYSDRRLEKALVAGEERPVELKQAIIVLCIAGLLAIVNGVGITFGLSFQRQQGIVYALYANRRQSPAGKATLVRRYEREEGKEFEVNEFPPLQYE